MLYERKSALDRLVDRIPFVRFDVFRGVVCMDGIQSFFDRFRCNGHRNALREFRQFGNRRKDRGAGFCHVDDAAKGRLLVEFLVKIKRQVIQYPYNISYHTNTKEDKKSFTSDNFIKDLLNLTDECLLF